ncbi:serine/threonine protein kinase [Nocardiopsis sp. LDBS1602]|uniref:serine/threonine protein kinase n=1 Tax=Nocardiopsis sp. LDBS1602 TaxID=3109597 RepID=UPI002DBAC241|nr:protein kinase [Nocardiopsis sp. LDBS1602]MEC3894347.1 protein kinase [Nocardiopsis sp. LDBS1602]
MDSSSPALPPNVTPLTDGDPLQVGRYRLVGRLGADGLGTLYAGVSPDHEAVSLKIAAPEWTAGGDDTGGEVIGERLDGVCGLGVRDGGVHEGRPWAAIDHVPGLEFPQGLWVEGRPDEGRVLALAAGLAEALSSLHSKGLVHGDLRPVNVVIAADGPRLMDFGLTRRIDSVTPTQNADCLGWSAPERYEGAVASTATDVHGWAGLVVAAATGGPPFGTSPAGHLPGRVPGQIVWEMAARAREVRVDLDRVPETLRPLVSRALSADPALRPGAEDVYLECLLLLGIDEQATADTWSDRLRELVAGHWPVLDLDRYDPVRWSDLALTPEGRGREDRLPDSGPGNPMESDPKPPERGADVPVPGITASGAAGARRDGEAADYLFGGARSGGSEPAPEPGESVPARSGGGRRTGLLIGAAGAALLLLLGGGYLLFDALGESSGVSADEEGGSEPEEGSGEGAMASDEPVPLDCSDTERVQAQQSLAHWRPFDPEAGSSESLPPLLTPGPEGVPVADAEIWPFAYPVDHDTVDFGLATPEIPAFPVVSVCMSQVRGTPEGAEFTVEVTYHPNMGSYNVYAEDFMALTPLDPEQNGGVDKLTLRGGGGYEFGSPLTTLAVLSPEHPSERLTVLIPGSPERGGVAYRPTAHSGSLVHELSGHCYDVDGTLGWRDRERLGSGFFALPDTSLTDNDMMDCPT